MGGTNLIAQSPATVPQAVNPIPDRPVSAAQDTSKDTGKAAKGIVSGVVTDDDGGGLSSAVITLEVPASKFTATVVAGPDGRYSFTDVPAGPFNITAAAEGLVTEQTRSTLKPGQTLELPPIELPVATATDHIDVVVSRHDVAEAEIKTEEQQRLLGVLPNFYVTYNWHATPLSAGQKTELAWKTLIDPVNIGIVVVTAGVEQATNSLPGYGPGAAGYGKRFAANYGNFLTGAGLSGLVFPILFHQDPRYFYKGTGTVTSRALYALAAAVICRGDNGKWQPNYSSVFGDLASGALSNLYYPASSRTGAALTFENGLIDIASDAAGNLVQEFLLKHLTPHSATYPPLPIVPATETSK
jgi:hypothetical protein